MPSFGTIIWGMLFVLCGVHVCSTIAAHLAWRFA